MATKNAARNVQSHAAEAENQAHNGQRYDLTQDLSVHVQELGEQIKEIASAYYRQGREKTQALEQTLTAQVQDKPLQSLLIAGGIGLLLGFLWRSR